MLGTVLHIGEVEILFWNGEPVGLKAEGKEFYTYPSDSPMFQGGITFGKSISRHFKNPSRVSASEFRSKMFDAIINEIYTSALEKAKLND